MENPTLDLLAPAADPAAPFAPAPHEGCPCQEESAPLEGLLGDLTRPPVAGDAGCSCEGAEDAGSLDPLPDAEPSFEFAADANDQAPAFALPEAQEPDAGYVPPDPYAAVDPYSEILARAREAILPRMLRMWSPPPGPVDVVGTGTSAEEDFYGDGSDGDQTVSSTETLTRDMFYENLTITASGRVKTAGYRVYVNRKLSIADGGLLDARGGDGADGSGATPGAGGAAGGGSSAAAFLSRGGAGGQGGAAGGTGSTAGSGATAATGNATLQTYGPYGLLSGCGGSGGGYYGSASGAVDAVAGTPVLGPDGGAGGTGYGVSGDYGGGGGGGGGGVVLLFAREIDNAGTIHANGGDGGDAANDGTTNTAGGGGGGGAGAVIVYYTTTSGSGLGLLQVVGGAGGGPVGAGGNSGLNGYTHSQQLAV